VSHWGNIAFEEYFKIENIGPRVNGEWSRVDYSIYHKGESCLKDLASEYPYYIKGLWISDYIGNISSSNALRSTTKVNLDFRPRFPLCGGWHTDWNQGYNVPVKHHLTQSTSDPESYRLLVPFYHSYDTLLTEEYTV
jgi:hypothetical protein